MGWKEALWSFSRDERVLLVSIGLAAFGVVSTITTVLTIIRDDNEIPPKEPKTQYITQETEDSLQLDTLEKLLTHPNYSIREVATKILCDRAINDPDTLTSLLYGITRPAYEERMRCLRALALLTGQTMGLDGLAQLNNDKAYSALVRSLELSLGDTELPDLTNNHWDEYYLRDMAERFCLMFIHELLTKYGTNALIKAKFVEKWLAKQKWGADPDARRRNFKAYVDLKDNRLVEIIDRIKHSKRGLKALERAGLIDKDNSRRRIRELPDIIMEIEEEVVRESSPGNRVRRPMRETSIEEQRLRRQHREAMVLNDGTRPLGREDIIERDHESPT
ncbi:cytoskeleton-associated protein [Pochonia chlamydosporia 170]|uniref:Cytoskeleton-associated protein n=1 Tax=Pochonia chlamydosporia 170 TaxID=1380566 RepID=A0A179FZN4_METCM|nr:cytoskeleton-associated protein [Pochonia chlamydosporia 170]OAQ70581.1 cytoskeleton-associated protein [Pochonia chlamydosporia 170]